MNKIYYSVLLFLAALSALNGQSSCPAPQNIQLISIGDNSATIDWTSGGASDWQVSFATPGLPPANGVIAHTNSKPFTMGGLSPATDYDVYVRDSCGATNWSTWTGPLAIQTLCPASVAPISENFDGTDWVPGNNATNTGNQIDPCWTRDPESAPNFGTGTGPTTSTATGPDQDASGFGNYLYSETSGTATNGMSITSPMVLIPSSMTQPELSFYYHMYGNSIDTLKAQVSLGSSASFNTIWQLSGQQQSSNSDAWIPDTIDLSAYIGDTIRVRFRAYFTSFNGDMAIDEFSIHQKPSCLAPQNVTATATSPTDVQVSWNSSGASNWELGYRIAGSASNFSTVNAASNPVTLNGLNSGTLYDIVVRSICGASDTSAWSSMDTAFTPCHSQTAPWSENFDGQTWTSGTGGLNGGNEIDRCWTRSPQAEPNFGTRTGGTGSFGTGPNQDVSGIGNYMYSEGSGGSTGMQLTSPSVFIPNSMTQPQLKYDYHLFGLGIDSLVVQISAGSGSPFSTITSQVGQQQTANTDPWEEDTISLSSFQGDTVRIRFISYFTGFNGDAAIDEIAIREAPTCFSPDSLSATALSANSVELNWATGGATNWQVRYRPTGSTGAYTLVNASSNPFTVSGLSPNTEYEFQVRDSCAVGEVSPWSSLDVAHTLCTAFTAPWSENFDSPNWTTGTGATNVSNQIGACWSRDPETDPNFGTGNGPTTSTNTGPDQDVSGSGNYLYSEASGGSTSGMYAETPLIAIPSSMNDPQLKFMYHMYGANIDSMVVQMSTTSSANFTTIWSENGQQQSANSDPWILDTADLNPFIGDTVQFRFLSYFQSFNGDMGIDEVEVREAPTCPGPSSLSATALSASAVELNWNSGGATNWQVRYRPTGSTGAYTLVNAASNPFTVTGLSPNTSYDFEVRDSCGASDVSDWSTIHSAITLCAATTAPWLEDFDGSDWVAGFGLNNTNNQINSCWTRDPETAPNFGTGNGPTGTNGTGPDQDFSGSGKYLYSEASGSSTPGVDAKSPLIAIPSSMNDPQLKFMYHMYGQGIDTLVVQVRTSASSNFTTIWSEIGQQQTASSDPWILDTADLKPYIGDTVQFRFRAYSANLFGDIAIDEVEVREAPTCPAPSSLSATALSANSVQLNWNTGGASNWQVRYRPTGSTGAYTLVNAASNPFTVTGLSPSTTYDFEVRDSCAANDVSTWTDPDSATTLCAAITAPWSENFDGPNWQSGNFGLNANNQIDPCWSRDPDTEPNFGTRNGTTGSTNTGPDQDVSGSGNYLYSETSGASTQGMYVETPLIAIPSSMNDPQLKFMYHMYGNAIDSLVVQMSTTANSNFTTIWSESGQQQTASSDPWILDTADLKPFIGDTVQFRFRAYFMGFASDMAIDEVEVREAPSCPAPSGLSATALSANSVELNWNTGGATNWQVRYRPTGSTGAYTLVNAASNPFTVTGLNPSTSYDFEVRDSCAASDVSTWTTPDSATTLCAALTAPWSENFDGSNWVSGGFGLNDNNQIGPCWSRNPVTEPNFGTRNGTTGSGNTGPDQDVSGSGNYLYSETSGASTQGMYVETPLIAIPSSMNDPQLKFMYHMYGNAIDSLVVQMSTTANSNFTTLWSESGQQQMASSDPWILDTADLKPFIGDTVQFRFRAYFMGFASDMAIDEVEVREAPSCPAPSNLSATALSGGSVELNWNTGGATNWQVRYRPTGSSGAYTLVNVASNPFTVTGLNPSTSYEFEVRDSCAVGDVSTWTNPDSVTTSCAAITAPWIEDFDGSDWVPGSGFANDNNQIDACWSRDPATDPNFGSGSGQTGSNNTGPDQDVSGSGNYLYSEASGAFTLDLEVESPLIAIPNSMSQPQLKFMYHMYGTGIDSLVVEMSTTSNSNFTTIWSETGQQQTAGSDAWLPSTTDISSFIGDTVKFRFRAHFTGFASDMAIDEVEVREAPSCPAPSSLSTTGVSPTEVQLNWTSGGAANWQIRYRPSGSTAPYTWVNANTNPFTVSGLSPSTSYDFEVRDSCGTNDVSPWTTPATGSTGCGTIVAPWYENFDAGNWTPGTGGVNTNNQINQCWSRNPNTDPNFGTGTGATSSANTGPDQDVSGSGNYIYSEASGGSNFREITTPQIAIPNSMSSPHLKFFYHMYGTGITSLSIDVRRLGQTNSSTIFTLNGPQQIASGAPWKEDSVDISAYIGDTVEFKIISSFITFRSDVAIDEIAIEDVASLPCDTPQNFSLTTLGPSSIEVSWTGSATATSSSITYFDVAAGAGSATTVNGVNSPYVITGLSPATTYDISLVDSCSGGLISPPANDTISTRACDSISPQFTYSSNFLTVNFNSSGVANADSLVWDFGTGSNSNAPNPTFVFPSGGTYNVQLIAYNNCGDTSVASQSIKVCDTLTAQFTQGTQGDSVIFSAMGSQNADGYIWDLDDGFTATGVSPSVIYNQGGQKTITLTVYNDCGDTVTTSQTIQACAPPKAEYTYTTLPPTGSGLRLQFDGTLSLNASTYDWDFGDGNTATGPQPIHIYATPGLFYQVTLTVRNACGQRDVFSVPLYQISVTEPDPMSTLGLYPNPARTSVNLDWDGRLLEIENLGLMDASGKLLKEWKLDEPRKGMERIRVEDLAAGLYWIRVNAKQGQSHLKLIVDQ